MFDLSELDSPFSEEEVWATIKGLPTDKALGTDGLTGRFYKSCWPIIKQNIMAAVSAIWSRKLIGFFSSQRSIYHTTPEERSG
jgi:hypothetical protein